jgi:hypothetical protein
MNNLKVIDVNALYIKFDNGILLTSEHKQECCEEHYLAFNDLSLEDFEGLSFDLSNDNFFNRIPEYGIELMPILGHSIKIPAYAYNNGFYSDQVDLVLIDIFNFNHRIKKYDITECQRS